MPTSAAFKAFFSYARADADADPKLIAALTKELEQRINVKFANDRFKIWRDTESLRTGDKWEPKLEAELRSSDVLIVLLTPRWLGSDNCRKEYEIFEAVEAGRADMDHVAGYVAPILAREVAKEVPRLTDEQKAVYDRVKSRQYQRVLAVNFLSLSKAARTKVVDGIADDIEGIIERRRKYSTKANNSLGAVRPYVVGKKEFDASAQNYEQVDFISNAEVVLDKNTKGAQADLLAQIDFVERLYVQGKLGRIEFGVRRAFLSIRNEGPGQLSKIDSLKGAADGQSAYYMSLHEASDAIAVCIDPPSGKSTLAELPLPPAPGENYLSRIATASEDVRPECLDVQLSVSLNAEGLHMADEKGRLPSQRALNKIKAIMDVAATRTSSTRKQSLTRDGQCAAS